MTKPKPKKPDPNHLMPTSVGGIKVCHDWNDDFMTPDEAYLDPPIPWGVSPMLIFCECELGPCYCGRINE